MAPKKPEEKTFVPCVVLCANCPNYVVVDIVEEVATTSTNARYNHNCSKCGAHLYYASFLRNPDTAETKLVLVTRERDAARRDLEVARAKLDTYDKVLGKLSEASQRFDPRMFLWPMMRY